MLVAQNPTALNILQDSINLSENTASSWINIWNQAIFDTEIASLWISMVRFGLIIAGIVWVFASFNEVVRVIKEQNITRLIEMLIWPLVIALHLGNNGFLLAEEIKFIRFLGLSQINNILEVQIVNLNMNEALSKITVSNAAKEQIQSILSECKSLPQIEFTECLTENQGMVEQIVAEAETQTGSLESLSNFVDSIFSPNLLNFSVTGLLFQSQALPLIRYTLNTVQWAFVNMTEASLILTAVFAPVAMGLSILPGNTRYIFGWFSGFVGILAIQLGYTIVVGMIAIVIVNSGGELVSDMAFLWFLCFFSPILASAIGTGGGVLLYQTINSAIGNTINLVAQQVASFVGGLL